MSAVKILAVLLIIAGLLDVVYGGFSYTKKTQEASIGPLELTVKESENVNIPIWVGIGVIVIGSGLLLYAGRKS